MLLSRTAFSVRIAPGVRAMTRSMFVCERQCWPTITFSSAVISLNRRMFWNVRAMPSLVTLEGSMPAMACPLNGSCRRWAGRRR